MIDDMPMHGQVGCPALRPMGSPVGSARETGQPALRGGDRLDSQYVRCRTVPSGCIGRDYDGYPAAIYVCNCAIVCACAEMIARTRSPIETIPRISPSRTTGKWRIRFSVMIRM